MKNYLLLLFLMLMINRLAVQLFTLGKNITDQIAISQI